MVSIATTDTPPVRAAIYARVSCEQQSQQSTIDSQIEALRERVKDDGLSLDDELCFIDDGFSGGTLIRPALERLRDVAYAGGFQRLYVHSPDRLARKYAWQVLLVEELHRGQVELVFLNHTIGASPEEDLLLQMQGMIAEYERTKIMERSRRGKRHAAKRGSISVLCGAPYGYRYVRKHDGGGQAYYQVNLEEARVVKQIFEWIGRDRMTIRQAVRRLWSEGIPSAKGKIWHTETVGKLLRNPAYKGQAVFGKTRVGERRPRLRPSRGNPAEPRYATSRYAGKQEDQIAIPVPAIVSESLFDAVAEQLAENRRRVRQQKGGPAYLLGGLLECACCGYAWYGKGITRFTKNAKAPYPYYRCMGMDGHRFGGERVCPSKPIRLDRLDAAVWSDVTSLLQNPEELRSEFERRLNAENEPDIDVAQVNRQIAMVQRSISRLIDAYEDGLLEKSEFEPRIQAAKERLARLQEDEAQTSDRAARRAELRLVLGHLDQFAAHVRSGLNTADVSTRREIIRSLVKVVKIEKQNVRIIYRIRPRPFDEGRSGGPIRQQCHDRVFRNPARDRQEGECIAIQEGRPGPVRHQRSEGNEVMRQALARARLAPDARRQLEELIAQHDPMGKLIAWARRARREKARMSAIDASKTRGNRIRKSTRSRRNDLRLPAVGSWITRQYQGREIAVRVLDDGFEFEGDRYRSLSAIAKRVTGSHWNGFLFFGITRQEK